MPNDFLVATFSDAETLMRAVQAVRAEGFRIYDTYAPYPIHEMDRAMDIRRSRLPWVTLLAGILGLTFAIGFQFYAAVLDWPLNVGGKPDNSTLAFIPISFEIPVLLGGWPQLQRSSSARASTRVKGSNLWQRRHQRYIRVGTAEA